MGAVLLLLGTERERGRERGKGRRILVVSVVSFYSVLF